MIVEKVDMTYSFLSDEEPTDEQLEQLMREVGEEARRKKKEARKRYKDFMQKELDQTRAKWVYNEKI